MEFNHGVLFSDTYQKKLKSQFYYADKDPQYGARLFFENSGGSLRLKRAGEAGCSASSRFVAGTIVVAICGK